MDNTKKLYRSIKNRYVGGVCGGLADYFNVDVVIIRLLFFVALVIGGGGLLAYIILWIVVPEEPATRYYNARQNYEDDEREEKPPYEESHPNPESASEQSRKGNLIGGLILVVIGVLFLINNFVTDIDFGDLWPVLLIIAGIVVLFNSVSTKSKKSKS